MILRNRVILHDGPRPEVLAAIVREFLSTLPRMEALRACYDGQHAIASRLRPSGLPNTRVTHDFPRYITTMAVGYLIGNPVRYDTNEADQAALEGILKAYRACAADSVDIELARAASIYGKGVELVFTDAAARPRTAALDPRRAFVVYDDTVENAPLLGVRLLPVLDAFGGERSWRVEAYTDREKCVFAADRLEEGYTELSREAHFFAELPMVEYWNGEDERGDFEGVRALIDAYDTLQSDRLNDKQQFVDALLILTGCTMEADEHGRSPARQLREDKVLVLPDGDARAEWLCKQLNETDTEVLKKAIAADIHKLSLVPDLSDVRFSGYESGIAMRYKLLGLEQLSRVKERWFREGLRRRLRLFAGVLALRGASVPDLSEVRMSFTRSVPVDELEQAQMLQALRGILPDEALKQKALRAEG